ncbi:MAG: 30S ribosomal protein S18 [Alphaproteobacteria bacterium]
MRKRKQPVSKQPCFFCQAGKPVDYKKVEELARFTTDRGKIVARSRTGICAKHQRQLAKAIKRARHLALLPFVA